MLMQADMHERASRGSFLQMREGRTSDELVGKSRMC